MDKPLSPILLIGAGNMGSAMVRGWQAAGIGPVIVVDPRAEGAEYTNLAACPTDLNVGLIVLAVKPGQVVELLPEIARRWPGVAVLSIAAGVTVAAMERLLAADTPVIRTMPNLPAQIGEGVFGAIANAAALALKAKIGAVLAPLGMVVWLEAEAQMDALTALSGSGPAYLFHFIEALQVGGEALGLPGDVARALALQTVKGAALLAAGSEHPAAELRRQVTSPNGTTAAALDVLMRETDGLTALITDAMRAAAARSAALSAV